MIVRISSLVKSVSCIILFVVIVAGIQPAAAQKKRPPGMQRAQKDTTAIAAEDSLTAEEKKLLPKLQMREYTITGTERLRVLPSQRNPVEMTDFTRRERVSVLEGQRNRMAPGAGDEKMGKSFDPQLTGFVNEAYASFGKYEDVNAGIKYRKKFTRNELFTDFDLRRSSGHVDYADYHSFNGSIADIRPLTEDIQNRLQVSFNTQQYKFYGSRTAPDSKRSGYYVDASDVTDILKWEPVQMSTEFGGRYYDPDESDIFNWDLWAKLNMRSVVGSTFITGAFEYNTDRIKDGSNDNAPVSDANYGRALLAVERLVTPRLHIKAGVAYYYAFSENANLNYNVGDGIVITGPFLVEREMNNVYPQIAVTYDFGEQGRFFAEYDPHINSFSLLEKLFFNQYLQLSSPFSYENVSQNLKIGWRRSYVYDLSFEIYYNDRKIENYGILIDRNYALETIHQGMWSYAYDNVVDVNEYRATVNWNPHPRFSAWTSLSYSDYTIRESSFAEKLPYVPELVGEISMQFVPGWAMQFILDGQFVDERETVPFDVSGDAPKLDSYFLANMTINKQWSRQISSYIFLYNIFNVDYEVWQDYVAPDFVGGAGLRFYW